MKSLFAKLISIKLLIIVHWFLFWTFNGFDKFFNNTNVILFQWQGKDRAEQFARYLQVDSNDWLVKATIYLAGVWELAIGLLFLAAIIIFLRRSDVVGQQRLKWAMLGLFLSALTLMGFSVFDVIAGDRAELLEHGTFLGVVLVSWLVMANPWDFHWHEPPNPTDKSA